MWRLKLRRPGWSVTATMLEGLAPGQPAAHEADSARRTIRPVLGRVGARGHRGDRSCRDEPQRLGLPAPARVTDPGQARQLALGPGDQVGERAPAEARGDDTVARVPAGAGEPRGAVEGRRSCSSRAARRRSRPSDGVTAAAAAAGKSRRSACSSLPWIAGCSLVRLADRAAEPVGEAAAADRDPVVRRSLRVDELVVLICDRARSRPSRARPRPPAGAARSRACARRAGGTCGARPAASS